MKRTTVAVSALCLAILPTLANARETTQWVTIKEVWVLSPKTIPATPEDRTYYVLGDQPWGMAGCPTNTEYLKWQSTDPGHKEMFDLALAAKMRGAQIQVLVNDCTNRIVHQIGLR